VNDPTLGSHPAATSQALILGLILALSTLFLPRRYALIPIILATCFLPLAGKYALGGLNFSMLRVVVTLAWVRILVRNEQRSFQWLRLDYAVLMWSAARVLAFTVLWLNSAAAINAVGYAYDDIGLYFAFRILLKDAEDFKRIFKVFALIFLPLAILLYLEKVSGRDPFCVFGGVPEFPEVREGVIRCQGPFGHPILAGTFGAVWLPLFLGLWLQGKGCRLIAAIGIFSSTLITAVAGSSGPIGSYAAGIIGMALWGMRYQMRLIRWGIVLAIVALDLVMKDPVWFIFARIDVLSGSTGWHRANLIDRVIANFSDWWLIGARDIAKWGIFAGDTTNQFIAEGIRAGIFNMMLFVWMIVIGFSYLGTALRAAKTAPKRYRLLLWSIGVALFAHVVSFFGVSYFDQNIVNFFLTLAIIATAFQRRPDRQPVCVSKELDGEFYDSKDLCGSYKQPAFSSSSTR
jgi:hypothetical protein